MSCFSNVNKTYLSLSSIVQNFDNLSQSVALALINGVHPLDNLFNFVNIMHSSSALNCGFDDKYMTK